MDDELELGEALAVEVARVARWREADGIPVATVVREIETHYVAGVCGAWEVKLDAQQTGEVAVAAGALYLEKTFMDEIEVWKSRNNDGVVPRSFRPKLLAAVKKSVDGFMASRGATKR